MEKTPQYVKEVQELLVHLENDGNNEDKQPFDTNTPEHEIDVYIEEFAEEDRITLIRKKPYGTPVTRQEEESELSDLDTAPLPTKPTPQSASNAAIGVWFFGLFVILFCLMFQFYLLFNPYTVTVTLYTRSQHESLQGTLQLGRVISPLTLSQSQTVPTTGRGHQDARSATGYITFYNGQFQTITLPAGTTLTGSDGVQIVTDQDANIPPDNPPVNGQTTVSAHAVNPGSAGNISAGDINTTVAIAVLAKNTSAFYGGQDERDFQTVAKTDITNAAALLKAIFDQSMQDTLTGQLKSGEALTSPSCTTTITADHQAGQEATTVKVTASETCSGIAYNTQELTSKVTQLLTTQAAKKLETGYSLLGTPQITVTSATIARQVTLSFKSVSTWVYTLSSVEQQSLKKIIVGKTTEKALQLLTRLPGIERVSLQSSGFGDTSRIPKDISYIHLALFYGL
jgi:Baseplate J-like protein